MAIYEATSRESRLMNPTAQPHTDFPAVDIQAPPVQTVPLVLSSPHSGSHYPADFVANSRLDPVALRASEDAFVDELFATAPRHGAPLLRALFPRAYVDPNRERMELDPTMFRDKLPRENNGRSPRVAAGLGTIARVVTNGEAIYPDKLPVAEALKRLADCYDPYHAALEDLIAVTRDRFGYCLLIDCHSMPSIGGPMDRDSGNNRVDFVLGDRFGKSCAQILIDRVEDFLAGRGHVVKRNNPYAGGFITRHYGAPRRRVHALQIEINRAIYMDESTVSRTPGMAALKETLDGLLEMLSRTDFSELAR